jgi:hypothetical protein
MPNQTTSSTTAMSQAGYYTVGATDLWPWPKRFFDKIADELTERSQKLSPLLCLPIDIRLIVYEYAMASGPRIEMNSVIITQAVSEMNFSSPTWSQRYPACRTWPKEHAHRHAQ